MVIRLHMGGDLVDGSKFISATVTDLAGNISYVSTFVFEVDTVPLEITSATVRQKLLMRIVVKVRLFTLQLVRAWISGNLN